MLKITLGGDSQNCDEGINVNGVDGPVYKSLGWPGILNMMRNITFLVTPTKTTRPKVIPNEKKYQDKKVNGVPNTYHQRIQLKRSRTKVHPHE